MGVGPETIAVPGYVPAAGVLSSVKEFDAAFFGYSPREAELMDSAASHLPRAWAALEGGPRPYRPRARWRHAVGLLGWLRVVMGYLSSRLPLRYPRSPLHLAGRTRNLLSRRYEQGRSRHACWLQAEPARAQRDVQTACSTSLVAVHLACQSLLARRVRHGAGRRRRRSSCRRTRATSITEGEHPLARRPLPRLRRAGAGHGVRRAASASSCCKRLADALADGDHDPRGDPRLRGQQRRRRRRSATPRRASRARRG